jgi:cytochrome o ubiquinol oxidase subunit III
MTDIVITTTRPAGDDKTHFGFWVYLMTDTILFATLFATYAVLHGNTYGGPAGRDIFDMPFVLVETLLLLTSSFTCGIAMVMLQRRRTLWMAALLAVTFILGAAFVTMELTEFAHLAAEGNSWQRSAFLSSFFTLVGTHGLHISVGLLWLIVMGVRLLRSGFTRSVARQLTLFSMFWHFLDVIWIFIFTIVYLMGVA